MREDKLIRPAAQSGFDGPLLAAAKRAAMCGDQATLKKIVAQLVAMSEVALSTKDKSLVNQCESLVHKLKTIISNPGAGFVMETKHAQPKRRTFDDSLEVETVKRGAIAGTITGYASTFGNVDLGGDKVVRGAFTSSLNEWKKAGRLPVMLAQHDSGSFPIGAWTSMTEDSHGLRVVGNIADTIRGIEAVSLISMDPPGLSGMSIGYMATETDVERGGTRVLKEIQLFEVSLVGLPMNPLARISRDSFSVDTARAGQKISDAFTRLRELVETEEAADSSGNVIRFPSRNDEEGEDEFVRALQSLNQRIRR